MPCTKIDLRARTDRKFIRSTQRSNRFIVADIKAPHAHAQPGEGQRRRAPVNLTFVIDRSGSMAGEKLRLAKLAVEQSIARFQSDDRFSVVVYDDVVDVVAGSSPATPGDREYALRRLAEVEARNMTNLGEGWLRGCEQVALRLAEDGVNRCLLLTDGLANVGITDPDELASHAAALRARAVSTSTFGVGADFDEVLLQGIATAGGGNFYYIASAEQIPDLITSEVGETLDVVARDVVLELATPDGVTVEALTPVPFAQRDGRAEVSLGSLVAEQTVQVVMRLNFPYGEVGRETGAVLSVADRDAVATAGVRSVALSWEYADAKSNDLQPRDVDADRAVAAVFAARARQEASGLNRRGNYEAARTALTSVAKRIRGYAGRDTELRETIDELETQARRLSEPMEEKSLKQLHFAAYARARSRAPDGKALRG